MRYSEKSNLFRKSAFFNHVIYMAALGCVSHSDATLIHFPQSKLHFFKTEKEEEAKEDGKR